MPPFTNFNRLLKLCNIAEKIKIFCHSFKEGGDNINNDALVIATDRFNSFDIESFKVDIINDLVTADVIDDQKFIVKNIEI